MTENCPSCGREFRPDDALCGRCGTKRPSAADASSSSIPVAAPSAPTASADVGADALPGNKNPAKRVLPLVIGLGLLPVFLIFVMGDGCESVEGQMAVTASPHGEWTFVPTGCASMQPYGLMGANVHADGPNDGAVYVTLDHTTGHEVELEVPGSCQNSDGTDCTVFEVPREACQQFDVDLEYTNVTVNDVRLVKGHVRLDCTLEDGTRIQGSIDYDGC